MAYTSHQSLNDQSLLLLYLAEELGPADHAAVERRLAVDRTFAAELEQLRDCQTWLRDELDTLDTHQPLPGTATSWQRRIGRMIQQWQVRQLQRQSAAAHARRMSPLVYPAAAAALVLISSVAWWGFQDWSPTGDKMAAVQPETPADPIQNFASLAAVENDVDELPDLHASMQ